MISDLNVQVHQFRLLHQVVDPPRLQPAVRLLLSAAQIDGDTQTGLGVVESRPVGPGKVTKLISSVAPNFKLFGDTFKLTALMIHLFNICPTSKETAQDI